jgi:hypothetical protein
MLNFLQFIKHGQKEIQGPEIAAACKARSQSGTDPEVGSTAESDIPGLLDHFLL